MSKQESLVKPVKKEKKNACYERITRIEVGSFTLLVNEEMGIESQTFFGKLSQKILDKPYQPDSVVVSFCEKTYFF